MLRMKSGRQSDRGGIGINKDSKRRRGRREESERESWEERRKKKEQASVE